jgi:hypothetical protein
MSPRSRILSFHRDSYGDLKTAVRALLHACGGETRAAERCRVSKSTLSEYGNPGHPDRHMPVDVALALEAACGELPVTEHMARAHGAVLLKLAPAEGNPQWLAHLTRIGKEASDVFNRATEYLTDHEIDAEEAPHLLRELDELIAVTAAMRVSVQARLAPEAGPQP